VGALYLGSLIIGLGILLMQVAMSSSKDLDTGGDASADVDADADADVHIDADGGHDIDADGGHDVDAHADHAADQPHPVGGAAGIVGLFLSFRFWTFAMAGFGLVGSSLHFPSLASPTVTLASAIAVALVAGLGASYAFRALKASSTNSGAEAKEVVGQVGKVLVPPNSQGHAKVRLLVKGQMIDYVATTDDESLELGSSVLVEELRGNEIHVSQAPSGLSYSDEQN
jgi:membrane protein implicated in regulation of membrane protease activity